MKKQILMTIVIAAIVSVFAVHFSNKHSTTTEETAFDRVVKTGTLRCGFATWAPGFYIDSKTGKKAGFSYEIAEALGKKLGLKIEWTEESGWGVAEQGLQAKRFDAMCAHVCVDARRTKAAYYSIPFLHEPIYVMTRADDQRFDKDLNKINDPAIKTVILRGSIFEFTANDYFPKTKTFDASELNADSDIVMSVISKKADVAFNTGLGVQNFDRANPGKIKLVGDPVRFCSGAFMLPLGDDRLKNLIDGGMNELIADGQIERIIGKFLGKDNPYWYPPSPLNPPKNGYPNRAVLDMAE